MHYEKCTLSHMPDLYQAFSAGFSDYIIKLNVTYETFPAFFFRPAGNQIEHSFIAYDGSLPVGMMLGGIRDYEGLRTMRCGGLGVSPDYRRQKMAQALYQLHRQEAIEHGCKQLFLEVIVGNDPAINFYKKLGYEIMYDLRYYTHSQPEKLAAKPNHRIKVESVSTEQVRAAANPEIHVNWQNTFEYMVQEDVHYFGVAGERGLLAYLCITKAGKIFQLWVRPDSRQQGLASTLLAHAVTQLGPSKLTASTPNNASLEGFLLKRGFTKDSLAQYKMYLPL